MGKQIISVEKIPLDGRITNVEKCKIDLRLLKLDIENPRIQYYLDSRLNEEITLDEVKLALAESNEQYERLKEHIEQNGGIYNPIWVVPCGGVKAGVKVPKIAG